MDPNLIPDILAISLFLATVFTSVRAFYLYAQARNPRLFILGLSMAVISLTAADNFVTNIVSLPYHTYWFLYNGQTVSYCFIWASFFRSSDEYLQRLTRWHILASLLVMGLLLLSPVLPDYPNNITRAIASGSRGIPCFGIFLCYLAAFMSKETRFSLLMSLAFLLLAFGPWIIIGKYFFSYPDLLDITGDVIRMVGLGSLLAAVLGG